MLTDLPYPDTKHPIHPPTFSPSHPSLAHTPEHTDTIISLPPHTETCFLLADVPAALSNTHRDEVHCYTALSKAPPQPLPATNHDSPHFAALQMHKHPVVTTVSHSCIHGSMLNTAHLRSFASAVPLPRAPSSQTAQWLIFLLHSGLCSNITQRGFP